MCLLFLFALIASSYRGMSCPQAIAFRQFGPRENTVEWPCCVPSDTMRHVQQSGFDHELRIEYRENTEACFRFCCWTLKVLQLEIFLHPKKLYLLLPKQAPIHSSIHPPILCHCTQGRQHANNLLYMHSLNMKTHFWKFTQHRKLQHNEKVHFSTARGHFFFFLFNSKPPISD